MGTGRGIDRLFVLAGTLLLLCLIAMRVSAEQSPPLGVNDELILDLRLDGRALGLDILGYRRGDEFLVALEEFVDAVRFPINVDADSGRAGGWFISEERGFSLDLDAAQVESDGQTHSLPEGGVVRFENQLFVEIGLIETWFPLELELFIRQLVLNVRPLESIPLQRRLARQGRTPRQFFATGSGRREPELPLQETPYRLLGPQSTDLRLNYSTVRRDRSASEQRQLQYSLLSRGDLAWMSSTLSLTGRDQDALTGGRLKLERTHLDGPLNLDHVEIGDVNSSRGGSGSRGIVVRGGPGDRRGNERFANETVDLRGDTPPDWEVELYRNGLLIDTQVVGDDAQYEFLDVELEFGENRFEFVLYGPFGEEQRETETFFVGPGSVGAGAIDYELSATQARRSVFDIQEPSALGDRDTGQYSAAFNLGLTRNLSASFDVQDFERDDERLNYARAGLAANTTVARGDVSYSYREDDQDVGRVSLRSRLGETRFSLGYSQFFDDGLAPEEISDDPRQWRASLSLSSRPAGIPVNVSGNHSRRAVSRSSSATAATTLRLGRRSRLSTSVGHVRNESEDPRAETTQRTTGATNVSLSLRPWSFRAGTSYDIAPRTELNRLTSSARLRVDQSMSMNFEVSHSPSGPTRYVSGLTWLLDSVRISPRVSYDDSQRWAGLISLSTSINPRPGRWTPAVDRLSQSGRGAVRARAFLDHDGDGVFGEDDEPLEGVRFDAPQSWRNAETDSHGEAYLTRLRSHRQTDIAIDPATLDDIDLAPVHLGRSVVPRPGSWATVDVPVVRAMELSGHVYEHRSEDSPEPLGRIPLRLIGEDGDEVARQRTSFDGFYVFAEVPPGLYRIEVGDNVTRQVLEAPDRIEVGARGGIKEGLDLILGPRAARSLIQPQEADPSPDSASERAPLIEDAETEPLEEAELPGLESAESPEPIVPPDPEPVVTERETGNWVVQLGAFSNRNNARGQWQTLEQRHPDLLGDDAEQTLEPSGGLIRLLAGPARSEAQARDLCLALEQRGEACLVRER